MKTQIRWMIRSDLPEVLEIEQKSFESPWNENDFSDVLRRRNCIGMVAEFKGHRYGYMVYELLGERIHLINIAVDPIFRMEGIGTQMIHRLIGKLTENRRRELTTEIRESNLQAQLFFQKKGFKAIGIARNFYPNSDEDAYIFRYMIPKKATSQQIMSAVECP